MSLVAARDVAYLLVQVHPVRAHGGEQEDNAKNSPLQNPTFHFSNSLNSDSGICPSRRTRGTSSVRSSSVEPPRAGSFPPSMTNSKESPNCSQTSTAVIDDASPLRLALL